MREKLAAFLDKIERREREGDSASANLASKNVSNCGTVLVDGFVNSEKERRHAATHFPASLTGIE